MVDIATTTSVQNSGLLDQLLPHYREALVRVHAAGSGRALEMLSDQIVDLRGVSRVAALLPRRLTSGTALY